MALLSDAGHLVCPALMSQPQSVEAARARIQRLDKDNFWAWIRIDCSYSTEFFNALTRKFHNVLWDTGVVKKPT